MTLIGVMSTTSPESRIAEFIRKYTPEVAARIVGSRKKLRALFPRGYELVFDNYNALVIGFAPTDKTSESFLSITGYPRWVTLFFLKGATLQDPDKLLQGSGSQVRGVRLRSPDDLDQRNVRALIAQAIAPVADALEGAPPLKTIIKLHPARIRSAAPRRRASPH
jgi:hypothetical protein